jgi:hypothetical protein
VSEIDVAACSGEQQETLGENLATTFHIENSHGLDVQTHAPHLQVFVFFIGIGRL